LPGQTSSRCALPFCFSSLINLVLCRPYLCFAFGWRRPSGLPPAILIIRALAPEVLHAAKAAQFIQIQRSAEALLHPKAVAHPNLSIHQPAWSQSPDPTCGTYCNS
jgi:hypothetical protein